MSVDLDDGSVLQLDQLDFYCCDDCEGDGWWSDPVIDAANQSLRYIYALAEQGFVVRLDHELGEVAPVAEIPEQWGQLVLYLGDYHQWMVLDYERRRVFVTAPTMDGHAHATVPSQ